MVLLFYSTGIKEIDLSSYATGLYVIKMTIGNKKNNKIKMLIKR